MAGVLEAIPVRKVISNAIHPDGRIETSRELIHQLYASNESSQPAVYCEEMQNP
jgi:hypothetical protein